VPFSASTTLATHRIPMVGHRFGGRERNPNNPHSVSKENNF